MFDVLLTRWRDEAGTLRRRGATAQAVVLESCAEELESALQQQHDEPLNLTQASRVSGYSRGHLGRLVRQGTLPNAGRRNAPRIRASDLPVKATPLPAHPSAPQFPYRSQRQVVRAIVGH